MTLITSIKEINSPSPCALALGFFDGVHLGHRAVIAAAARFREANLTPAAFSFSTDRQTPPGKAVGRIYTDAQRVELLEECGIERVLLPPFEEIAPLSASAFADLVCARFGARQVCCGSDYRFSKGAAAGAPELEALCAARGAAVTVVEPVLLGGGRISSTQIRDLLAQGDVREAARMLGAPYRISAVVGAGRQLGRSLGFPTVNQPFAPGAALPRWGVYASRTFLQDGRRCFAVTNVGVKPTVGEGFAPGAETFIMDFAGDLYGEHLRVELLDFLRPEEKFDSLEALKAQIAEDCARARAVCARWGHAGAQM